MTTKILTCTIACSWNVGEHALATLRTTDEDVGFTRQEVTGTRADFEAAIVALEAEYQGDEAKRDPSFRRSITAVIKRFRNTIRT